MDYIGKWKVAAATVMNEDLSEKWVSPEEYVKELPSYINKDDEEEVAHEIAQREMMMASVLSIEEDNTIYNLMPIPSDASEEEVKEGIASGDIVMKDDMMLIETYAWKEVDGVLYVDLGGQAEVLGESLDTYQKAFDEEGFLNLNGFRFVKM